MANFYLVCDFSDVINFYFNRMHKYTIVFSAFFLFNLFILIGFYWSKTIFPFHSNYEDYVPLNNEPTFVFSPANLDHNIDFNLTTATFSDPEYYRDIDSGSYSQLSFICGFRNGSRSSFTNSSYITLNIETGTN